MSTEIHPEDREVIKESITDAEPVVLDLTRVVKVDKAAARFGMAMVKGPSAQDVLEFGLLMEGVGTMRMGRGHLAISQRALTNAIVRLNNIILSPDEGADKKHTPEEKERAMRLLGYLSDKLAVVTKVQSGIGEVQMDTGATKPPPPMRPSFIPGSAVLVRGDKVEVHHHHHEAPNQVAKTATPA